MNKKINVLCLLTLFGLVGCGLVTPSSSEIISSISSIENSEFTSSEQSSSEVVSSESSSSYSSMEESEDVITKEEEFDFTRVVTFDSKGGSSISSLEVDEGEVVSKPTNPTKTNYSFLGWYLDGELYDFNSPVYFDITLEAKWQLIDSESSYVPHDFTNSLMKDGPLTTEALPCKPTNGNNPKVLVFPVRLQSTYNASTYSEYLNDINIAFTGNENTTGWESVKSYYQESSYGNVDLDITVWDEWFYDSSLTPSKIQSTDDAYYDDNGEYDGPSLVIDKILDRYNSQIDFSNYDSDSDGYIDAIWLIYDYPVDYEDSSSCYWAFVTQFSTDKEVDGVSPNYYGWAGVDFMYEESETYDQSNIIVDAHTYIHETGHLFGLDDYYDYDENKGANRGVYGADMMDYNVGDHNSFSKLLLDWVNPMVITSKGTVTLDLSSFTTSGQCILIADHEITSIYDSYYLVEYYTNDGLNSNDQPIIDGQGIRILKVNAQKNLSNGEVVWNEGTYWTGFKYDNSDTSLPQLECIYNSSIPSDGWMSARNLFTKGTSYTSTLFDLSVNSVSNGLANITITIK